MRHLHLERCTVDLESRTVRSADGLIDLSDIEVKLLAYLAARQGRAVERDELLVEVWGMKRPIETRCVDTAVRRLRVKLEVDPANPRHLLKVHGVGYRLDPRGPPPPEARAVGTIEVPPGRFVGREDELAWLGRAMRGDVRRIWIMGPPGSGRRRLALEAAVRHGGVFPGGVHRGRVDGALRGRALVVLPEGEVPDGAVALAVGRPGSSAEPVLRLGPLDPADAVALLLDRAGPLPDDVAERLVAALDRLPLAIEEAAARVALLGADEVLARLHDAVLLPELHRRSREVVDALPDELVGAATRCAAFRGPFRLDAGEAIVGEGALAAILDLVDRGLLIREVGAGPARLTMPRALRQVLAARDPDREDTDRWHLATMLARGEARHARYRGPDGATARAEVVAELDDALAAHATALRLDPVAAARLCIVLDGPFRSLGRLGFASELHDRTLAVGGLPPVWSSRLLQMRCEARRMTGRIEEAREDAARSLADALAGDDPIEPGCARAMVALVDHTAGQLESAEAGYREAVQMLAAAGEEHYQALWLGNLGRLLADDGRHGEAEVVLRRVLELRLRGGGPAQVARARGDLGWLLMELGLSGEAESQLRAAIDVYRETGDRTMEMLEAHVLGRLLLDLDRAEEGLVVLERVGALATELGEPRTLAMSANFRGVAHLLLGDVPAAERELRRSIEVHRTTEQPDRAGPPTLWLTALLATEGRLREAEATHALVEGDPEDWHGLRVLADVALDLGRARQARTEASARARLRERVDGLADHLRIDSELRVAVRWLEARVSPPSVSYGSPRLTVSRR